MKIPSLLLTILIAAAAPAAAKSSHSPVSVPAADDESLEKSPFAGLEIGLGIEAWSSADSTEFWFPGFIEYNLTDECLLVVDHAYVSVDPKSADIVRSNGFDDLYTSLQYEFLEESGIWPSLALEAGIKWPTAANPETDDPGRDYTFGILAHKDWGFLELELNLYYTFIGEDGEDNEFGMSLWAEYGLTDYLALNIELSSGSYGGFQQGSDFDVALGLGWDIRENLRLEQGVVVQDGGEVTLVAAWEWSFEFE